MGAAHGIDGPAEPNTKRPAAGADGRNGSLQVSNDAITGSQTLVSDLVREDPDMIDIVEEFVTGLTDRVADLKAAYDQSDWTRLKTLAHQLKGAGGSYGYPPISELAATIEEACKQQSGGDFANWIDQLNQLRQAASNGLRCP